MPIAIPFFENIKVYTLRHKPLYAMSLVILFWALFDGLLQYFVPIAITNAGISKTMMGIIIGTSSITGMFFDILLCKILKNAKIRRIYLLLFLVCVFYPLVLWQSNSILMFIFAMAIWGIYYDLFNIGRLEFVSKESKEDFSSGFGVLQAFFSIGYLIVPFIAVLLISNTTTIKPFIAAWLFLGIAFIFFIILLFILSKQDKNKVEKNNYHFKTRFSEFYLWKRIGKFIYPVLILTLMLNIIDATYWGIGPLISETWTGLGIIASLFMIAYLLPQLLVGWFVSFFTSKYGTKKTAIYFLFIGCIILTSFFLLQNPLIIILVAFIANMFITMAYPANRATYADYVSEVSEAESEIESEFDFATNLGYVIGPMLAGFLADFFGNISAFGIIGLIGAFVALILYIITPKEINIKLKENIKEQKINKFIKNKV